MKVLTVLKGMKVFKALKGTRVTLQTALIMALIAVAVALGGMYLYMNAKASAWEKKFIERDGAYQVIKTQYAQLKLDSQRIQEGLRAEREAEKVLRLQSESRAEAKRQANIRLARENEKLKSTIKKMTGDELTNKLNVFVPTEYSLLLAGDFHLTRPGGEKTLSIFYDEQKWRQGYNNQGGIITELGVQIQSFENVTIPNYELALTDERGRADKAEESAESCDQALIALKKAYKWGKVVEFGKGAGTVVALVAILKLVKVF